MNLPERRSHASDAADMPMNVRWIQFVPSPQAELLASMLI
jgi:hypothetical protein